jgi:hypothetical protein
MSRHWPRQNCPSPAVTALNVTGHYSATSPRRSQSQSRRRRRASTTLQRHSPALVSHLPPQQAALWVSVTPHPIVRSSEPSMLTHLWRSPFRYRIRIWLAHTRIDSRSAAQRQACPRHTPPTLQPRSSLRRPCRTLQPVDRRNREHSSQHYSTKQLCGCLHNSTPTLLQASRACSVTA